METTIKLDSQTGERKFFGQSDAVRSMLSQEQGLIVRPPGTGKTQIALSFIAQCKTRTLVLVHTDDILEQWVQYARKAIPGIPIGIVKGNKENVEHLTIATVQTLSRRQFNSEWFSQFGCTILDEAHHAAASTFEIVLNQTTSRYRFGFSASPTRADGMEPLMKFIIGPIIHKQEFKSPIPLSVVPVRTSFKYPYRGAFDWTRMLSALERDEDRNTLIAREADMCVRSGESVLILSRRITHLRLISEKMETFKEHGAFLVGTYEDARGNRRKLSQAERKATLKKFRSGRIKVVLATQLADEALDVPILSRVILSFPGKHDGRLVQQIGRAIREHKDKKDAVVFDFIDHRVGVLRRQWNKRRDFYRRANIEIKGGTINGAKATIGRYIQASQRRRRKRSNQTA